MGCGYERHIICIKGLMGVMEFCWCDVYVWAEEDGVGLVHTKPLLPACHNLMGFIECTEV
jgi:hypothetical protein